MSVKRSGFLALVLGAAVFPVSALAIPSLQLGSFSSADAAAAARRDVPPQPWTAGDSDLDGAGLVIAGDIVDVSLGDGTAHLSLAFNHWMDARGATDAALDLGLSATASENAERAAPAPGAKAPGPNDHSTHGTQACSACPGLTPGDAARAPREDLLVSLIDYDWAQPDGYPKEGGLAAAAGGNDAGVRAPGALAMLGVGLIGLMWLIAYWRAPR